MLTANDLADFVTWPGLENAMRGLRDMLDSTVNTVNIINQRKNSLTPIVLQPTTVVISTQTTVR
jgi:hypothetical protein